MLAQIEHPTQPWGKQDYYVIRNFLMTFSEELQFADWTEEEKQKLHLLEDPPFWALKVFDPNHYAGDGIETSLRKLSVIADKITNANLPAREATARLLFSHVTSVPENAQDALDSYILSRALRRRLYEDIKGPFRLKNEEGLPTCFMLHHQSLTSLEHHNLAAQIANAIDELARKSAFGTRATNKREPSHETQLFDADDALLDLATKHANLRTAYLLAYPRVIQALVEGSDLDAKEAIERATQLIADIAQPNDPQIDAAARNLVQALANIPAQKLDNEIIHRFFVTWLKQVYAKSLEHGKHILMSELSGLFNRASLSGQARVAIYRITLDAFKDVNRSQEFNEDRFLISLAQNTPALIHKIDEKNYPVGSFDYAKLVLGQMQVCVQVLSEPKWKKNDLDMEDLQNNARAALRELLQIMPLATEISQPSDEELRKPFEILKANHTLLADALNSMTLDFLTQYDRRIPDCGQPESSEVINRKMSQYMKALIAHLTIQNVNNEVSCITISQSNYRRSYKTTQAHVCFWKDFS